jgi:hypothetical protein
LHDRFQGFGRALGKDHAAVWFWTREPRTTKGNPRLVHDVDSKRNVAVCTKLNLDITQSPHVVVTRRYPDVNTEIRPDIVLSLGSLPTRLMSEALERLAGQVISNRLDQAELDSAVGRRLWADALAQVACWSARVVPQIKARIGAIEVTAAPPEACKP